MKSCRIFSKICRIVHALKSHIFQNIAAYFSKFRRIFLRSLIIIIDWQMMILRVLLLKQLKCSSASIVSSSFIFKDLKKRDRVFMQKIAFFAISRIFRIFSVFPHIFAYFFIYRIFVHKMKFLPGEIVKYHMFYYQYYLTISRG